MLIYFQTIFGVNRQRNANCSSKTSMNSLCKTAAHPSEQTSCVEFLILGTYFSRDRVVYS